MGSGVRDLPVVLTIAGSDSGGGAGIQADLQSIRACGAYATTAITCLTAQNPDGVAGLFPVSGEFVRAQAEQVHAYFKLGAVKTGMLLNAEIIEATAAFLSTLDDAPVVVDPVMVATSGALLLEDEAVEAMVDRLFPLATLLTPNLDEVRVLAGERPDNEASMLRIGGELARVHGVTVLMKGGHLEGEGLVDLLIGPDREVLARMEHQRHRVNTHGSGCTLASAIAARLACGRDLPRAVEEAYEYLQGGLEHPLHVVGVPFMDHLARHSGE